MKKAIYLIIITVLLVGIIYLTFSKKEIKEQEVLVNGDEMVKEESNNLEIKSTAFSNNNRIPEKYTCDGEDINPELEISGVPKNTRSLVLIMDDPDAPVGTWVHWILYNINPSIKIIEENSFPSGAKQGVNSWGVTKYGGPCPPSGEHRYFFKLYALDNDFGDTKVLRNKENVENEMRGHIIAETSLIGVYSRE